MKCVKCGVTDEYLLRSSEDKNPSCRHCGGYLEREVRQKFNAPNSRKRSSRQKLVKILSESIQAIPENSHPGDKIIVNHSDGGVSRGVVANHSLTIFHYSKD